MNATARESGADGSPSSRDAIDFATLKSSTLTTLASGELMISGTDLHGRSALRMKLLNHRTTEDEVRRSVAAIARAAIGLATG